MLNSLIARAIRINRVWLDELAWQLDCTREEATAICVEAFKVSHAPLRFITRRKDFDEGLVERFRAYADRSAATA